MRVGLIGAQGVGKSTLAEAVSNETDLPLLFTKTTEVFKKAGLRPDQVLDFETRMAVQHLILDSAEALWGDETSFVTDRTPIDMLAYTMIDFNSGTRLTPEQTIKFVEYMERCFESTNRYFTTLILVQPGITFDDQTKSRAALDKAVVETMNSLMMGLMLQEPVAAYRSFIPRQVLNLQKRVMAVIYSINRSAESLMAGTVITTRH